MSPTIGVAKQIPFERVEKATLVQYSQTFQRLLCYIVRVAPAQPGEPCETGAVFSSEQWLAMQEIRARLQQPAAVAVEVAVDQRLNAAVMGLIVALLA